MFETLFRLFLLGVVFVLECGLCSLIVVFVQRYWFFVPVRVFYFLTCKCVNRGSIDILFSFVPREPRSSRIQNRFFPFLVRSSISVHSRGFRPRNSRRFVFDFRNVWSCVWLCFGEFPRGLKFRFLILGVVSCHWSYSLFLFPFSFFGDLPRCVFGKKEGQYSVSKSAIAIRPVCSRPGALSEGT